MSRKVKSIKEISGIAAKLKKQGKVVVTTNGTFDVLHNAHFRLLQKCKELGDDLIVLLNSDSSVKRFKGDKRPINPEDERAEALSYLEPVDYIVVFSEDKPLKVLQSIKPNIHAKGGSFIEERIKEEKDLLESWGGKFVSFEMEKEYSSTNVIQRVLDAYRDTNDANKSCVHEETELFNRNALKVRSLKERESKSGLSIMIKPKTVGKLSSNDRKLAAELAQKIRQAKKEKRPIIFSFGAHFIKNGLSLVLIDLMKNGYVSHILGNGAVSIHDWEFSYQGKTEEDVRRYIAEGQFGIWDETGKYINGAINKYTNMGYGGAVGKVIWDEKYKYRDKSILGNAYNLGIPVSICPGIGYDIIYTHPSCDGAAIGKASYIDFLKFAKTVQQLEGGVYVSIGSAITSPMVFEKSLSMANNVNIQKNGKKIENFTIFVNDIQPGTWNWKKGEPPKDNPAYYLRFNKTFARMGGDFYYLQADNRDFMLELYRLLI